MTDSPTAPNLNELLIEAEQALLSGKYELALNRYEQVVLQDPSLKIAYWMYGVVLLLQGQEAEAQMAWLTGMADGSEMQTEAWQQELLTVLDTQSTRLERQPDIAAAWLLRQHLREIAPSDLSNLLQAIGLSLQVERFAISDLAPAIAALLDGQLNLATTALLESTTQRLLAQATPDRQIVEWVKTSAPLFNSPEQLTEQILTTSARWAAQQNVPDLACQLAEVCLNITPNDLKVWMNLASLYRQAKQWDQAIAAARHTLTLAQTPTAQLLAHELLLLNLIDAGGYGSEAKLALQGFEQQLQAVIAAKTLSADDILNPSLFQSGFLLPYCQDTPAHNRSLQNQAIALCHDQFKTNHRELYQKFQARHAQVRQQHRPLKIGYLSHCFYNHSVGWLSRWLPVHHDRQQVEVHAYSINHKPIADMVQQQFEQCVDHLHLVAGESADIAAQIFQDEIDILVDLNSITLDVSCEILSFKPAPIQATWLGWDASGLPTIDYFIADPYVLPPQAQEYYTEKIWRLPTTYIAVDGFEVGVPTLRREDLDIPDDAVVYFSGQRGLKRHEDNICWQLEIIKAVSPSYLVIKGNADLAMQDFFTQLAQKMGVDPARLRFLPDVPSSLEHRANLMIADVVLDTYPYNGATTTLETLWMGIPIVTRVGKQFSARNGYTLMMNAGITEGIAWTDQEYIEWGIRLGQDAMLREAITRKLQKSRQTAPLWHTQQFTRDLEHAYQQMWANYIDKIGSSASTLDAKRVI
jgi:predicted O-linked N-acetylglucosamine transferase (SPINDLY family)